MIEEYSLLYQSPRRQYNMDDLTEEYVDDLIHAMNEISKSLKGMKEDIHYITAMMEDKEYYGK